MDGRAHRPCIRGCSPNRRESGHRQRRWGACWKRCAATAPTNKNCIGCARSVNHAWHVQTDWTALIWAAGNGHVETTRQLVRLKANIEARSHVREARAALRLARYRLPSRVLVLTLSARAQSCWTALIRAAMNGHGLAVAELIRLGADLSPKTNVHAAAQRFALRAPRARGPVTGNLSTRRSARRPSTMPELEDTVTL